MLRVAGIGAGRHAKVVVEILRLAGQYEIVGLLDAGPEIRGRDILGIPVLGDDKLLEDLYNQGIRNLFFGLGGHEHATTRRRLFARASRQGWHFVSAIHPRSIVSDCAEFGEGVTVMAAAVINPCARLGKDVTVNTGAIVEHDCVVEDHSHIAPAAQLAGSVHVGEATHVGIGATVIDGIRIGNNVLVGAGAVVTKDVPDGVVIAGVPARVLGERENHE